MNKANYDLTGKYVAYHAEKGRMYLVDYRGRFHHMAKGDFARAQRYAKILGLPIKVR